MRSLCALIYIQTIKLLLSDMMVLAEDLLRLTAAAFIAFQANAMSESFYILRDRTVHIYQTDYI